MSESSQISSLKVDGWWLRSPRELILSISAVKRSMSCVDLEKHPLKVLQICARALYSADPLVWCLCFSSIFRRFLSVGVIGGNVVVFRTWKNKSDVIHVHIEFKRTHLRPNSCLEASFNASTCHFLDCASLFQSWKPAELEDIGFGSVFRHWNSEKLI